ncbi:DUF1045 domain-containing protein [Halothiobacillus sp.]|uniref:DUF1045 domain-containing protein n=1 Tax=Halothiobacillus sp. TaxID=1891311 RepID=UPI002631E6BF|nr:DUF1045 domain-containing protein [Halothiobacillus sp.]
MRIAVYYAPEVNDPLWQLGCAWLGRDACTNHAVVQPNLPDLATNTRSPRRYGFHATLKAPVHLVSSLTEFEQDVAQLARQFEPFTLPPLSVLAIQDFAALVPLYSSAPLHALADACVTQLDHHRLPEDSQRQAERSSGLTPKAQAHLARWGYPFVLDQWQFHMTLCNSGVTNPTLLTHAKRHFEEALNQPRQVISIATFIEDSPGAPLRLSKRFQLGQVAGHFANRQPEVIR